MSEAISEPFAQGTAQARACAHPECAAEGLYRAPVSPSRLSEHLWFCLDHIRIYNQQWDYFKGRSAEEIEAIRRRDTVWQRPSWPLGGRMPGGEARLRAQLRREFGLGGAAGRGTAGADPREPRRRPASEGEKALVVLELAVTATFAEVKQRYKELVKALHPDANGGSRRAEERLKVVNQAYAVLKRQARRQR